MAFVVETGVGVANANAYIDTAFADDYFLTRGVSTWVGADTVKQIAIIKATDYIELRFGSRFYGAKQFNDPTVLVQPLSFPRLFLRIDGQLQDGVIPVRLKKATAEYALRSLAATLTTDPTPDIGLISEQTNKVGPIETHTKYIAVSGTPGLRSYPAADLLLRGLLPSGNGTMR